MPQKNQQIGGFVLNNAAEYPRTVFVFVPGDNGRKLKTKLPVRFKHMSSDRRLEILDEYRERLKARAKARSEAEAGSDDEGEATDPLDLVKGMATFQAAILHEALVHAEPLDPDKKVIPWTDELKAELIANSWAHDAMFADYMASLEGRDAGKNS